MPTRDVTHYGARGDGVTDDAAAIRLAITAARGEPVTFRPGRRYLIGSPLVFEGLDVDLRTDGARPATICTAGQDFTPLTVKGTPGVVSATLTESIGHQSQWWRPSSTAGVVPGMLMAVQSDRLWYHDPRPESRYPAYKSELHRVAAVSGGSVITADPAFDGYNLAEESVTLTFHKPVAVDIDNLAVEAKHAAPAWRAAAVVGLDVQYTDGARLHRVTTRDTAAVGVTVRESYAPTITGAHTTGHNDYYTGYGIQLSGCTGGVVERAWSAGCRRGVDVSGGNIVSRRTRVRDCTAVGGGWDSRGNPYSFSPSGQWSGVSPQYGFGTHGASDDVVFDGCTTHSMHHHYTMRGRNETIRGAKITGRAFRGAIVASHGSNLTVENCHMTRGFHGAQAGTNYQSWNDADFGASDCLVYIGGTYDGLQDGAVVLKGNMVEARKCLIVFERGVAENVSLLGNRVRFHPATTPTALALARNMSPDTATPTGWHVGGNDYQADPHSPLLAIGIALHETGATQPGVATVTEDPNIPGTALIGA